MKKFGLEKWRTMLIVSLVLIVVFVITIFAFRGIINHSNLNFISHVKYYTRGG